MKSLAYFVGCMVLAFALLNCATSPSGNQSLPWVQSRAARQWRAWEHSRAWEEKPRAVALDRGLTFSSPGQYRLNPQWTAILRSFEFVHGAAATNAYQETVQLQKLAVKPFGPFGGYALVEQIEKHSCSLWGYCSFLPSLNELRTMTSFSQLGRLLANGPGRGCSQVWVMPNGREERRESASFACFTTVDATSIRLVRVTAIATNGVIETLRVREGIAHPITER